MSKPLRFLIASVAALASLVLSVALYLFLFDNEMASGFGAATAVTVFFYTYKSIKSPKAELVAANTKVVEEFHTNGIAKERGKLIYGKREGEWEYYNEEGVLIREDIYNDGHMMRSIDYTK